jgi:hypothetical protein
MILWHICKLVQTETLLALFLFIILKTGASLLRFFFRFEPKPFCGFLSSTDGN